jgi:hypothetical protein
LWIPHAIFQSHLFDDPAFTSFCFQIPAAVKTARAIRADDVHADFAGCIAAQDRTILAKDDLGTTTGRRYSARHACRTAASNEDVTVQLMDLKRHQLQGVHRAVVRIETK